MSSEWRQVSLKDVLATIIDYRGKTPPKSKSGVPVLTAANVKAGRVITDKVSFISQETYDKVTTRGLPKEGDILITTEAPVGEVAPFPNDRTYHITRRIMALRCNTKIADPNFLLYTLLGEGCQQQLRNRTRGSTVPRVLKTDVTNLNFLLPPLATQKAIGNFLSTLDRKIQLNRHLTQTLDLVAQAIFKSWFVDFEPVRAKVEVLANGGTEEDALLAAMQTISGKEYTQLLQMRTESPDHYEQLKVTAELFPSSMQDSELGALPAGWELVRTERYLDLAYGKALKKADRVEGPYPVYGSGGITGSHSQALVAGPGIIVGRKGTVGSVYWESRDFYPIDTVYYVSAKESSSLLFSYYLLQTLRLESMNTDAAVPGLNRNNVYRLEVPCFPEALIDRYDQLVTPLSNEITRLRNESESLTKLRDTLLPKLMSGELTLSVTKTPGLKEVAHV